MVLSVWSDLSVPLTGNSAQRSPASPAPDQVCACSGVLSTQVVFNEPADLNIFYLTRHWFGPCSPAVLTGGSPTAFNAHRALEGRQVKERKGRDCQVAHTMYREGWERKYMNTPSIF